MNFSINDMYEALNHLTGAMAGAKSARSNTIDHSYITPTIIALGDFPDSKINELLQLTQGEPTVIWNLGAKPLSNVVKAAFQNQIIDAHWKTPCQYTRAPLLETVFSLCQSIKSWYDLNDRNLSFIHCPSGQPSTGIVVACLLKYIGAFEHAAHAYDFYCSKRLKGDTAHTLAPSYRNLFTNVDKIVDNDGYANSDPRFLKTITIAGLPVEEMPCVEVWDINGMIFSSHTGWNADPSCTWNTDYGDGFFKVSKFLLGDFSIICRFGGNLAGTKDKSTLIFKYQNTTAFSFEEILELKAVDVDINPQYAESLDVEIFTVHLMFENNPSLTPKSRIKDNEIVKLPSFPKIGIEAFEAGLDEISKLHSIVPDPKKFSDLLEKGTEEKYLAVALQLSNNNPSSALEYVESMQSRVKELNHNIVTRSSTIPSPALLELGEGGGKEMEDEDEKEDITVSEDSTWEVIDAGCVVCKEDNLADQLIVCSACPRHYHTFCVGLRKIPPFGTKSKEDQLIREKYIRRHFGEWKCAKCQSRKTSPDPDLVAEGAEKPSNHESTITIKSNYGSEGKQTQSPHLMSPPSSRQSYSVATSGGGVIVTEKVRTLTSPTGQPFPQTFPSISSSYGSKLPSASKSSGKSHAATHPMSPSFRSKQDQIAILVAMLSSSGVGIEELMGMSEEKQKEVIVNVISKRHPEFNLEGIQDQKGSLDLATALKGILSHGNPVTSETKLTTTVLKTRDVTEEPVMTSAYKTDRIAGTNFGSGGAVGVGRGDVGGFVETGSPARLEGKGGEGKTTLGPGGSSGGGTGEGGSSVGGKKADPRAVMLENLKRRQLGSAPKLGSSVGFGTDKLPTSPTLDRRSVSRSRSGSLSSKFGPNTLTISRGNVETTKAKDIPELADLFLQIKAGTSKSSLAEKIVSQGIVDSTDLANSLLTLDPEKPLPPDFKQKFNILVSLATHPKYEKFYKMLKVGISKDIVRAKMQDNNLDPSIIDHDPEERVPLHSLPSMSFFSTRSNDDNVFISVEEQHKYVKFVKMSQTGVSMDQIRKKMQEEGLDPDNLSRLPPLKDGTNGFPGFGPGLGGGPGGGGGVGKEDNHNSSKSNLASTSNEKVPISEHPKYAKYFKMLKIGLEKDAVKAKMQLEGVDPNMLDKDPKELIPLHEGKSETNDKPKVAAKDHPKYSKFFQMLKVGVPMETVKGKMKLEGLDPTILDKDPNELVSLQDEEEEVAKVPVSEHPVYAKFFKMLKVGLPVHVIKAKMEAEGANPAMIDKDPSEMVPLEEKKDEGVKVPAAEHPVYSKFFKMLKMGVPVEVIKAKMALEKADPAVIDGDASALIPLEESSSDKDKKEQKGIGGALGGLFGAATKKQQPKQRKKKLYWKAIDASQVNENSLWAERNDDDLNIHFDEDEFNMLFVEPTATGSEDAKGKKVVAEAKKKKEPKKQKVVLIDMKRAQNGGIALARIRFDFDEVKKKIMNMDDDGITTDQLKSLIEYLPTPEEAASLRNYRGEMDSVGVAERYMMKMLGFASAQKRIQCMIYKQQFRGRYLECRSKIAKIQNACDDVKLSARLKKVLKYILKVGNQLNDGEEHKGFTVDSLLKLQSAKAYDKKTTVLQYVITLIYRNDEDCLKFPEDLKHVSDAARLSFEVILSEKNALRQEFSTNLNIVEEIRNSDPDSDTDAMLDFLTKADQQCSELERGFEKAREKFSGVLVYFGEDPNMSSQDFYSTLSKFISEFISVRDTVIRLKRLEMKRQQQQQQQQQSNTANRPSRRATTSVVRSDSGELAESLRRSGSAEKKRGKPDLEPSGEKGMVKESAEEVPKESEGMEGRPAFLADIANMAKKGSRRRSNLL